MEKNKRRICVVNDFITDEYRQKIDAAAEAAGFTVDYYRDYSESAGHLGGAEIIFTRDPEAAREASDARWIADSNAGVDPMLEPGVMPDGAVLTKGAGSYGVTIAEHVVCVVIMLLKRFPEYFEHTRKHEWFQGLRISSVYGSRITIVGTGDIGKNVAHRMKSFDPASITGVNRSGRDAGDDFDRITTSGHLHEVLPDTDILIVCVPGTSETVRMIGKEELDLLPETALLVNVGRGSAVDQRALTDALNSGSIAGASVDVTEIEPLPSDDPLWDAKNIIITPHISGQMTLKHTSDVCVDMFCGNIARWAAGEPLVNVVDLKRGY
jgi:phosphoglycerate dehydrogenase-like enzyme